MGLNTLTTILEKKGSEFLEKFLSEELIITEKLDTYRILFEKQGDKLVFFKKDNTPLNLIERTLTNIWEDAIIELNTIIKDIMIPEGLRFGIAYSPVEKPIRLPYTKIPKYILTDVTLRKNNKVVESYSYDEVTNWASILKIGRPPIIFEGKLSEKEKYILRNYGLGNYDNLEEDDFAKIIESLFNKSYSEESIIEGIIIKGEKDLAQIVSYEFDLLNEAYEQAEYPRDYYDLILINLNKFLDSYRIPVLEGATSDEMYIEIVSDIFNKFYEKNPLILENVKAEFLNPPAFGYYGGLNLLLIKNNKTLEILEKGGKIYEALYRMMLSSLRKPKKEFGLLNESVVQKFNTYVYLIKNVINEKHEDHDEIIMLNENQTAINEVKSDNVVIDAMNKRNPSDVDNMRVIASIQKAFEPATLEFNKGKDKAVIYITECQPFSLSQMENVYSINRAWKCPVILASMSNKRRVKGEKFHFTDLIVKSQLDAVAVFNKAIVPAYFLLESWDLTEIFQYCRPKYEPIAIITDKGKKSEFAIQLYFEDEVMGGRISVDPNFNIGEMESTNQLQAFRGIEDNLFHTFKEYTPQPIWGLFDSMQSEYRTWNGEIIPQFKESQFV